MHFQTHVQKQTEFNKKDCFVLRIENGIIMYAFVLF